MEFKPFFVHFNRHTLKQAKGGRFLNGFTAFVQPSALDRHVQVQVTYCSAMDNFCRKTGRETAQEKEILAINTRDLPNFLEECRARVLDTENLVRDSYLYVLKYVV